MNDHPRLFQPCLSAEKVLLTPRLTPRHKFSSRRGLTTSKPDLIATDASPFQPVNSYSFIGRRNLTETKCKGRYGHQQIIQLSHHVCTRSSFDQRPTQLKRVQSIKVSPKVTFDAVVAMRSSGAELEHMLVIKPAVKAEHMLLTDRRPSESPKRDNLCGKVKSSFLQFFKARKRQIKASQSPNTVEGMLHRFLQIRRSKLQTEHAS